MPYANNQGVRLHYQIEGTGPALVLQHGFTDSLENWYELGYVNALKQDYQLILVDARGHGASDKPQDPHVHAWQFYVADLIAVLDHLHIPTAHFFGYSMGGSIGFAIAQFAPQRFASLIIGGAAPYQRSPAQVEARLQALKAGPEGIVAIWDTPISPALQARLLANDVEAIAASWIGRMQSPGLQDVLPTMTMPCLVFVGEADSVYPAVQACVLQMPKVIFVSFPGLKHAETHFRSDLVLPYVTNFLATVTRQATAQ